MSDGSTDGVAVRDQSQLNRRRIVLASLAAAGGAAFCSSSLRKHLRRWWNRLTTPAVATPYTPTAAPDGAATLHFIVGVEGSHYDLPNLASAVDALYTGRIPGIRIVYYRFGDDVHALVRKATPVGPLMLAGFSYGGSKAVEVCRAFKEESRRVDHLILFDPVQHLHGGHRKPNVVDFVLPPNVVEAVCFYREATAPPFSAPIRGTPATRYENRVCGKTHGEQILDEHAVEKVALAMRGRRMVDPVLDL